MHDTGIEVHEQSHGDETAVCPMIHTLSEIDSYVFYRVIICRMNVNFM